MVRNSLKIKKDSTKMRKLRLFKVSIRLLMSSMKSKTAYEDMNLSFKKEESKCHFLKLTMLRSLRQSTLKI